MACKYILHVLHFFLAFTFKLWFNLKHVERLLIFRDVLKTPATHISNKAQLVKARRRFGKRSTTQGQQSIACVCRLKKLRPRRKAERLSLDVGPGKIQEDDL